MNKIDKFLKKLSTRERKDIEEIVTNILGGVYEHMDVKKMKGYDLRYRVRKGRIRIIFNVNDNNIKIEKIEFRNDNTY